MRRGDILIHDTWLDAEHRPLRIVVTCVRKERVYWRQVWQTRGGYYTTIDDAALRFRRRTVGEAAEDYAKEVEGLGDDMARPASTERG